MMKRLAAALLVCTLAWLVLPGTAGADYMVADLSKRRIDITLGFSGADVLLYGSTDTGGDVIVVVRGPNQTVTVRHKDRILGIWVNREWVRYDQAPAFYYVASSKPLESIATDATLASIGVGLNHIRITPSDSSQGADIDAFRAALIRAKERESLYGVGNGAVSFIGGRLFRTTVAFPATVATGPYTIEVFLIRDGKVANAQRWPLFVTKVGLSASVVEEAHLDPLLYGFIAVFIAVMAGWLGSIGLRKV